MNQAIVGAVLAGGRSGRMGRDKARLSLGDEPLAARAAAVLRGVFSEVIVVVGAEGDAAGLGPPVIRDRVADAGPLGGLDAALAWAGNRPVFVLACDLPRVDGATVDRIVGAAGEAAADAAVARVWVAARGGHRQPLCALYSPACGPRAAAALAAGTRAMHQFLDAIEAWAVPMDDIVPDPLVNLNTPADRAALAVPGDPSR